LSVEEQIEGLTGCIAVGAPRAKQAKGKDVLMIIGNTKAGQSTTVNFLHGGEMESFMPNKSCW
jgi:ribosome biogenesis GTPase A